MKPIALALATLLFGASMVGCGGGDGGSDEPAVCGSVDALKTSVDKLKDIKIASSGAVSDLESAVTDIQADLGDVKADAKSEFSSQIDAAEKSYAALKTSVDAAKSSASVATLRAVRTASSSFGSDVDKLITDIQATC